MIKNARIVCNGGTPLFVQPRRAGNGVILSQGSSYLVIGSDEIDDLVGAMKEMSGIGGNVEWLTHS